MDETLLATMLASTLRLPCPDPCALAGCFLSARAWSILA